MGTACCKGSEHGEESKEICQSQVPHVNEEETNSQHGAISQSATFQHEFHPQMTHVSEEETNSQHEMPHCPQSSACQHEFQGNKNIEQSSLTVWAGNISCVGSINPTWHQHNCFHTCMVSFFHAQFCF